MKCDLNNESYYDYSADWQASADAIIVTIPCMMCVVLFFYSFAMCCSFDRRKTCVKYITGLIIP